jgi:hypothetical protein
VGQACIKVLEESRNFQALKGPPGGLSEGIPQAGEEGGVEFAERYML